MKICPTCKKEFLNKKHPETIYCSNKCRAETRKKTIIKKCLICDKEFSTIPAWNKKYCSPKCYWKSLEEKPSQLKGIKTGRVPKTAFKKGHISLHAIKGWINKGSFKKGHKGLIGEKNPNWTGGRVKSRGYILIHKPKHPFKTTGNYIYEHRLIMEKLLKRYLKPEEIVHHINNNHSDNRIENLMLFANNGIHTRFHHLLKAESSHLSSS